MIFGICWPFKYIIWLCVQVVVNQIVHQTVSLNAFLTINASTFCYAVMEFRSVMMHLMNRAAMVQVHYIALSECIVTSNIFITVTEIQQSFNDSLSKLVPQGWTILDFIRQRCWGGSGISWTKVICTDSPDSLPCQHLITQFLAALLRREQLIGSCQSCFSGAAAAVAASWGWGLYDYGTLLGNRTLRVD